jgi:hypothetical protein
VPFFFKFWGEWFPMGELSTGIQWKPITKTDCLKRLYFWPNREVSARIGKKAAGRLLDGRTWEQLPERRHDP